MTVFGIARSAAEQAIAELRPLCEELPDSVIDPISLEVFDKPMVTRCGHTFEKQIIIKLWNANPNINIYDQKVIDCPICKGRNALIYIFYDQAFQETIEHVKKINEVFVKTMGARNGFRVSHGPLPSPPKVMSKLPLPPLPRPQETPEVLKPLPQLTHEEEIDSQKVLFSLLENASDQQPESDKRLEILRALCEELPQSAIDPINLEPFHKPMVTRCGHTFERESLIEMCKTNAYIDRNLNQIIICPICRTDIDAMYIFYDQSFKETIDHLKKIQGVFKKYVTTKQT